MSLRRRIRSSDERGFTLIELLVAMSIGVVLLLAAFMLLDRSFTTSASIADRQDGLQRGRQAMELMTRQLRSQVCVIVPPATAYSPPVTSATDTAVTFYGSLNESSTNVEKRTLTFSNAGSRVHHPERDQRDAEHGLPADGLHRRRDHHHAPHQRQAGRGRGRDPARLQVLPLQARRARRRPGAAHGPGRHGQPREHRPIKIAFRAYAVRPITTTTTRASSRTTSTSGSRTPASSRRRHSASDPPLPAGLHHGHPDGRADDRRAPRRGQLRRRGPGPRAHEEGRRLEAGLRGGGGRDRLLPQPPGAGLELLHALRERAVGRARTR